ncbi:MAG: hypothetical protein AABY68_10715 [Pseudomonadota bacterium]
MQGSSTKIKLVALTLGLLVLTGCATRERYESELQGWVGSNIKVVMDAWGYPSGSFESPTGNLVYVWDKQGSYTVAPTISTSIFSSSRGGVGFGTGVGFGFGQQSGSLRCQTYFEVDKAKTILNWKTQGNDCRK